MPRRASHYFLTISRTDGVITKDDLYNTLVEDVQSLVVAEERHLQCSNDTDNYEIQADNSHLHCYFKVDKEDVRFRNIGNVRDFVVANLEVFDVHGKG